MTRTAKEHLQAGSENVVPVTTNLKWEVRHSGLSRCSDTLPTKVGELFPGPSKATRAYIRAEADVERALKKVGWKIRKRGLVTTQFYLARLVEASTCVNGIELEASLGTISWHKLASSQSLSHGVRYW
ncbi:hypothetical protein SADUNF_Sadunf15G0093700 [Salix dunnii]|uniref:Magnesium-protoporphyrin IX methyltransferase C-terminal domain-containing protein n=1 Tax=Salix dunnii TaxID=1413687 RepID=A0A835MSM2_9ROSI|nr:hypothetical protein SADUNF_Sadunf15G0093700 [Salix dunnii]